MEGKDIKRWRTESRGLWLIYIPKNKVDIDQYPAIKSWLLPFKEKLEKRATKQEWFELQQAQEGFVEVFVRSKIIYPDLSQGAKFSIDESCTFVPNTGYLLDCSNFTALANLNAKLTWFYLRGVSSAMRGGEWRIRMFSQYIETIPIPDASDQQKAQLATLAKDCQTAAEQRLELQRNLSRRIPDLCPPEREAKLSNKLKNWWEFKTFADFKTEIKKQFKTDIPLAERNEWEDWIAKDREAINLLSAEIKSNEDKINELVYQLFDLTPEEIKLLETNI